MIQATGTRLGAPRHLIRPGIHFLGKGPASESFRFAGRLKMNGRSSRSLAESNGTLPELVRASGARSESYPWMLGIRRCRLLGAVKMKKEAGDIPMHTGRAAIPRCPFPLPLPVSRHLPARPYEEVAVTDGLEGRSEGFEGHMKRQQGATRSLTRCPPCGLEERPLMAEDEWLWSQ